MAWGMFCWIPCPYKGWREEDRKAQLAMLPLLGACMGVLVCLIWWALTLIGAGQFITGAILTGAYFLMTGFIHLDGFMDCSDAIMPRHPDMAERRRILKDPANGAFAVACLGIMLVVFAGAMVEIAPYFSMKACCMMVVVFTVSRFMSAMEVLLQVPMSTSQYSQGEGGLKPMGTAKDTVPAFVVLIIVVGAAELIVAGGAWWALIAELNCTIVAVTVLVAAAITCNVDRKKLGGMNGDISGHMITLSEMFGLLVMALMI